MAIVQRCRLLYLHRRRPAHPQLLREYTERGKERAEEVIYRRDAEHTELRTNLLMPCLSTGPLKLINPVDWKNQTPHEDTVASDLHGNIEGLKILSIHF